MNKEAMELTISQLTEKIESEIGGKGYSKRYVDDIHRVYKFLREYAERNNIVQYKAEVGIDFVKEQYSLDTVSKIPRSEIRRAINMLSDYQLFGMVLARTASGIMIPEQFSEIFENYLESYRREKVLREATMINARKSLRRLGEFLDGQGILNISDISIVNMNDYVKCCLCNYSKQRISHELFTCRQILRYIYQNGYHNEDLSSLLMKMKGSKSPNNVPSAFSKEEVERMLACIDRGSPVGKRDYALLLLIARLGIRAGDIRSLCFENIDWKAKTISFIQSKTNQPIVLPLLDEIGWAIIDYIRYSRPKTDSKNIFIRQVAPFTPLKNFNEAFVKYLRKANIEIPRGKPHGVHSLRHSLVTTLLMEETPMLVIRDIAGHISSDTTIETYAGVDFKQLMECALEVPDVQG